MSMMYPRGQAIEPPHHGPTYDKQLESILAQLSSLDQQNLKLHSIADSIMKTSFLRPSEQSPAIITQYEEDMKSSFNMLIESIREFFISIDNKIRHLGVIVENKITQGTAEMERSTYPAPQPTPQPHQQDRIDILLARMGTLEDNIKRTQDNQAKLMNIVQDIATRRGEYDQQPTIIRSSAKFIDHLYTQQDAPPQEQRSHQKSFRLFSVGQNTPQQPLTNRGHQYPMIESKTQQPQIMSQVVPPKQREAPKSAFGCLPDQPEVTYTGYLSVKKRGGFNSNTNPSGWQPDASNRNHRLTTLVKALKQ